MSLAITCIYDGCTFVVDFPSTFSGYVSFEKRLYAVHRVIGCSYKTAKPTTLFTAVHKSCVYTLISKMADESKRNGPKLKRRRSEERDKKKDHKRIHPNKRKKEEKNKKIIQPRIPKTATDISSNWKLLQVVRNH